MGKLFDLTRTDNKVFAWLTGFTILYIVAPLFVGTDGLLSDEASNLGQWVSGLFSILSMPFLIYTIQMQTKASADQQRDKEEQDSQKTFEENCKSIDIGLSYIKDGV